MRLIITRESFLFLPTSSILYALYGGLGDSRGGGVVDCVALALASGFDAGVES